jgi:hypothetical protein
MAADDEDDVLKRRVPATAQTRASLPRTKSSDGVPTSPARPRALRPAVTEAVNPFDEDEKTERATRSDLRRVTGSSVAALPRIETGPTLPSIAKRTTTAERTQLIPKSPAKPRG